VTFSCSKQNEQKKNKTNSAFNKAKVVAEIIVIVIVEPERNKIPNFA